MTQQPAKHRNAANGDKGAETIREQRLSDMSLLLATRPGRRFIWGLMAECGIFRSSFDNSGSVTAFNEGRRQIGLRLLAEVNEAAPEQYLVMLRESQEGSNA